MTAVAGFVFGMHQMHQVLDDKTVKLHKTNYGKRHRIHDTFIKQTTGCPDPVWKPVIENACMRVGQTSPTGLGAVPPSPIGTHLLLGPLRG